MQLEMHYLNLFDNIGAAKTGETHPVTVERLLRTFQCTDRNAKLIIRKMEELGWIAWQPGRGRGRTSEIALLADPETLLEDIARRLAEQGDVRGAMRLVQERSRRPEAAERFAGWLTEFFGFSRDDRRERPLDTLRVPVYDQIVSFDPADVYFAIEGHICRQIYDTLTKYDPNLEDAVPRLAHHWESNEDGTLWTFYLRKGVLFHHKRELVADDVVYTFRRLSEHPNYGVVAEVAAIGPHVVQFRLRESCVWFPRLLGFDFASILPSELLEQQGERFFDLPVGTGPFQLVRRTDRLCVLDAFPHYFLSRAHLDRVELHFVSSDDDLLSMTTQLDLIQKGACGIPGAFGGGSYTRLRTSTSSSSRLITFNLRREGPQQQPAFRQALREIIDRERLMKELGDDRLQLAEGFLREANERPRLARKSDPERIRSLLSQSGYDGQALVFDANVNREKEVRFICEQAAAYGIALQPRLSRHCDFQTFANDEPGHLIFYSIVMEEGEATLVDLVFSKRSGVGMHLLDDASRDIARDIMRRMFREPTIAGRWRCVAELSDAVRASNAMIFLFHAAFDSYFDPKIGGVEHNALGMIDFRNVWFKVAK